MFTFLFRAAFFSSLALLWFGTNTQDTEIRKSSLELPADLDEVKLTRVAILKDKSSVTLNSSFPFEVWDDQGYFLFSGSKIVSSRVGPAEGGLQMGSQRFSVSSLLIETGDGDIEVDGKKYRNGVQIWRQDDQKILVINRVPLEGYLKGVLPKEVRATWPEEALKAQAVISRTYALFLSIEKADEKWVLNPDVSSQVYGGVAAEHPATSKAVDATAGEVLTYQGRIFPTFFHSTCGGGTSQAYKTWDIEDHQLLQGVTCEFCQGSKHYYWKGEWPLAEVEKKLKVAGFDVEGVHDVRIKETDPAGRVTDFQIYDTKGKARIRANDFRLAMGPFDFKSTRITSLRVKDGLLRLRGRGWGHGVGVCQYGMKKLAELGYNYRQIVDYYFPGARLTETV